MGSLPEEADAFGLMTGVLLGHGSRVANDFAIDPHTGRMYVAATAPDGEGGTVDGVSELGALYCLEMPVAGGPPYTTLEAYHTGFAGGSGGEPPPGGHARA